MDDIPAETTLPRLILIGDRFTDAIIGDRILGVAEEVPWIHLRDHHAEEITFGKHAKDLAERIRMVSPATMISVNGRVDVAADLRLGYHAGSHGASVSEARKLLGRAAVVGFSAHYVTEAEQAIKAGADYVFFSPIFASPSKPGHMGVGLDELRTFCGRVSKSAPVYAVGGITPERVGPCLDAGAHGVGVLAGILEHDDVLHASREYVDAL